MNLLCLKNTEKEKIIEKSIIPKTIINQFDFEIKKNNSYSDIFQKSNTIDYDIKKIKNSFSLNNISYLKKISNLRTLYCIQKIENSKTENKPIESFETNYINNQSLHTKIKSFFGKPLSKTCSSELIIIDYPNHTEEKNKFKRIELENGDNTNSIINNNINNVKGNWRNIEGDIDLTEMNSQDFENENNNSNINYIKRKNLPYCLMTIQENKYLKKVNKIPKYNQLKKIKNFGYKNTQKNRVSNYSNYNKKLINVMRIKINDASQKNCIIEKYSLNASPKSTLRQKNNSQNIFSRTIDINNKKIKKAHKKDFTGNVLKEKIKIKNKYKKYIKKLCNKYIKSKRNISKAEKINFNYLIIKKNEISPEIENSINNQKKYPKSSRKNQTKNNMLLKSDNLLLFQKKLAINKMNNNYLNTQEITSQSKNTCKIKSIIKKTLTIGENIKDYELTFQKTDNTENFDDKNQKKTNIINSNSSTFNTNNLTNIKDKKNGSRNKIVIKYIKIIKNENSGKCFEISKNKKIKSNKSNIN